MFLVSTRCGIVACRHLADCYYRNLWMTAPEIAQKYNMNVRSLMPALRSLTRAGILKSRVGGKTPGFRFAQDPKDISIHRIITTLEGELLIPCCREVIGDLHCDCGDKVRCRVFSVYDDILEEIKQRFSSISVAEHAGLTRQNKDQTE